MDCGRGGHGRSAQDACARGRAIPPREHSDAGWPQAADRLCWKVNAVWRIGRAQPDQEAHAWAELIVADRAMTFEEVWQYWQSDEAFRDFWIANLRGNPCEAWCWECPPVNERNRSRPFECVFVSSPSL